MGDADIDTLTMEQLLELTRGNQASSVVKPEIKGNVNFKIESRLREDTFSGNKNDDAYEHVEWILDIVSLFKILGVTHDAFMLHIFTITLTGAAKQWVDNLSPGTINTWDLLKKAFYPKHDGSPSSRVSNDNSYGIAAITNKLDSLGRDIKKPKENVHAIQVGCENYGGSHLNKESPLNEEVKSVKEVKYEEFGRPFPNNSGNDARYRVGPLRYYTRTDNQPPSGERKLILTEIITKYMEESTKKKAEHDEWLKKFQENEEGTKELEEIKEVATQHEPTHLKVTPSNLPVVSYYVAPYEPSILFPRCLGQHAKEALVNQSKSPIPQGDKANCNSPESATPEGTRPWSFTLPCSNGKLTFNALADLGASISIVPLLGSGVGVDTTYPENWIRRIGVSWSRDHARIRRIFLDGYGVLVVRICSFTIFMIIKIPKMDSRFMTLVKRFVIGGNGLQMGVSVLKINIRAYNKALSCSFIYADNYYVDRRALWNNLDAQALLMHDKPWVLLEDFNVSLNLEDHSCGGYKPNIAMREFKKCVQKMEVMDGSFAIFQPYSISDHSPYVLRIPKINIRAYNKALSCSFIYADNYYVDRRALWNNLDAQALLMHDKPWVLLEDFNVSLNLEDHSCGGYKPNIAMREFKKCVQKMEVMDGSFAIFQPYSISDHSPYVLRIPKVSRPKHKPFKLSNFLVYKEGFRDVVKFGWNFSVNECVMYRVVKQLKGLKTPLRKLLYDQGNLHDRVNRLHLELDEAQKAINRNPSCLLLRDEHAHYLMAFKEASLDEERFLRQKSKIEWLNAGDSNMAYFQKIVKSKCARNKIKMVRHSSNVLHEENVIASAFVSHYEQFLGIEGTTTPLDDHGLFFRILSHHKAEFMIREVFDSEIKGALFSMGDDKAPGPNGVTATFFKKSWDIVGGEIAIEIRDFFSNSKLLKELNHTIISLIPKVYTPTKISDYRLISCCNVLFKCISKIIVNRIKGYLGDLVSINQSAFIPGRRISDNVLLTQELMCNYHRKRRPSRCAFKVDIQKAYDTVEWGFIRSILVGFGFHPTMVDWIMVCVTTTSYSISINGDIHGWFNRKCGLRQDDIFLFTRSHPNSIWFIMDALEEFKNVSGLVLCIPKSTAFFCNVPNTLKANILSSMPFAKGTLPIRYLGVPLISSRLLYRDCKLMRGFLWCQGEMKKGKAKVVWEAICLPHREGGLGIRRIKDFNIALMATHIWCILINKESWPHDWSSRFPNVVNILVLNINNNLDDEIVWCDVQGVFQRFSVAGAWVSLRLRADVVDWYHVVWFPHCIPRHAIHMWLMIKEKLKTQDRLWQWDVGPSIDLNMLKCPLYDTFPDSHSHFFLNVRSFLRMKLVTFKFKNIATGSRLLLDQWRIPSSCFDHDGSSSLRTRSRDITRMARRGRRELRWGRMSRPARFHEARKVIEALRSSRSLPE
nr:hypothetical protein [Tanacetum cinerariifolium]